MKVNSQKKKKSWKGSPKKQQKKKNKSYMKTLQEVMTHSLQSCDEIVSLCSYINKFQNINKL